MRKDMLRGYGRFFLFVWFFMTTWRRGIGRLFSGQPKMEYKESASYTKGRANATAPFVAKAS